MRPKFSYDGLEKHPLMRSAYRTEWGMVVGRRVRLLRQEAEMTIYQLADELYRGDGRPYSPSFVSRLERGWASCPLHTYVVVAERFGKKPGELLGLDGVERDVSEPELTLVRALREMGISPEEAIARLARPG